MFSVTRLTVALQLDTTVSLLIALTASIVGSIISSTILKPTEEEEGDYEPLPPSVIMDICGANDCPDNNETNPNLQDPSEATVSDL